MHISVKRTGGFAGVEEAAEVDTGTLDRALAQQLEALVRQAHILDPSGAGPATPIGTDFIRGTITVTEGGLQHALTFVDEGRAETAPLNQIIDLVLQAARR